MPSHAAQRRQRLRRAARRSAAARPRGGGAAACRMHRRNRSWCRRQPLRGAQWRAVDGRRALDAADADLHRSGALVGSGTRGGGWALFDRASTRVLDGARPVDVRMLYAGFASVGLQYGLAFRTLVRAWGWRRRGAASWLRPRIERGHRRAPRRPRWRAPAERRRRRRRLARVCPPPVMVGQRRQQQPSAAICRR